MAHHKSILVLSRGIALHTLLKFILDLWHLQLSPALRLMASPAHTVPRTVFAGLPETKSYELRASTRIFLKPSQIPLCKLSLLVKTLLSEIVSLCEMREDCLNPQWPW